MKIRDLPGRNPDRRGGQEQHGWYGTPEYDTWANIKWRCSKRSDYRGRVRMCPEWARSFSAFIRDMGERPPGTSIDRIDNNGNYEPGNCRWATATQQCRNKRTNRFLTHRGETKTMAEWAEIAGVQSGTFKARIRSGWSTKAAIETPVGRKP